MLLICVLHLGRIVHLPVLRMFPSSIRFDNKSESGGFGVMDSTLYSGEKVSQEPSRYSRGAPESAFPKEAVDLSSHPVGESSL